jgi:3'(2'), 5'-bisphosphate nucleotidase
MNQSLDDHSTEVVVAIEAVLKASALCQKIRNEQQGEVFFQKRDGSPVTLADFGSQAILCKLIREKFPNDVIVAEENAEELRNNRRPQSLEQITSYINTFIPNSSLEEICTWIDFSSDSLAERFWALDPIDGTRGFLRGDQYAIALALIEHGIVKLGVLACPNLYVAQDQPGGQKGCLFIALKEKGSFQIEMNGEKEGHLLVSKREDPSTALLTESVEPDHTDLLLHQRLAQRLKMKKTSLRMDSQTKYGIVARGEADFYVRVPSTSEPDYLENIWDHAAGSILVEEAGGRVTDILGNPLDFSCGIKMVKNRGILASNSLLHDIILEALKM